MSGRGLRVGLTGGLGSGKSTVAAMLRERGAEVLSADEIARGLMQPGERVYAAIVRTFGAQVVAADGTLDRRELARLAFAEGRVEELNAIVHPATIARQAELTEAIFARAPDAIVVVESALILETQHGGLPGESGSWRDRFDRVILVTAPDELKIARFVARSLERTPEADPAELAAEARRRLAQMISDEDKLAQVDFTVQNDGSPAELTERVEALWKELHGR